MNPFRSFSKLPSRRRETVAEHTCSGGTFADVRLLLSTDIYLA